MGKKTAGLDNNKTWCQWCHTYRSPIRFDKHLESCRLRHVAEKERRAISQTESQTTVIETHRRDRLDISVQQNDEAVMQDQLLAGGGE
jgi:hypothetical protein